ncbi:MAG TPA: sigma-54-dependent Fis family transcriptional regulator [Burkholderiales bacterium]|nr:sigma-54-dependent Fis family transcriptional regulator [Burkholderiales bacterium]
MLQPSGTHARYIYSIIRGGRVPEEGAAAPEYVKRSWLRCLDDYGLDPDSNAEPLVVSHQELLARKQQSLELMSFADTEMANLYQQLAGSGYSIILTDREGVLLSYYGDPSFRHAASRTGLVPGAVWSERHGGTNGMGTCLLEQAPVIIHREHHFLARNTGLTCCAAPVFDHRGELVAVLDASGESDRAQQHTLVLVNMSAQMIENRLFLHRFRDAFVVRFHSRPELVGTWSEGIVALDLAGAITAVDRNALFQLGYKRAGDLVGAQLERLFNISLPALVDRSHRKSFHPLPIYEARHGGRFFAVAQEPESRQWSVSARRAALRGDAAPSTAGRSPLDELDHGDPAMARNIAAAKRVASRDVPILLVGETGTGKELFARALHAASERAEKPFIAVNCAAIPEALLRNELFGSGPSGIVGATREGQRGKIVQAHGGTLFLDEISDLAPALQAQLLHVLEEREVIAPVTETPIKVDVRLVSTTHCGLQERVGRGEFREDLFYRLQGLMLTLPPLRERKDRRALVRHVFAQEAAATPGVSLSDALVDVLCAHQWPGNIRQLRNVLRAMIALRARDGLDVVDLPADYGLHLRSAEAAAPPPEADALNPLGRAEREALLRELEVERGNISHVARKLGVSRNTLYRKMQRLRIRWPLKKPVH